MVLEARIAACLLSLGVICSVPYYFVIQANNSCTLYSGKAYHNAVYGRANLRFSSSNGSVCTGVSKAATPTFMTCQGEQGFVTVSCSDNRNITGKWSLTKSCARGHGDAVDNWQNHYQFFFGTNLDRLSRKVNALREKYGCADVRADGADLEVEGKILSEPDQSIK